MSSKREKAKEEAVRKIQEADLWWNRFYQSVNEVRAMKLRQAHYVFQMRHFQEQGGPAWAMYMFHKRLEWVHDTLITLRDNVESLSRSAVSCEMAHRIYMEEFEQRHWEDADEQE